jgi:exodeoxyribonuclease V beta subunit
MQLFDLYKVSLNGTKLIEASAGTGKTYTLSGLYIRYIVEKRLTPDQILVVTFTKAATAELKGRLRQQLIECKNHLSGFHEVSKDDNKHLFELYESYKNEQHYPDALKLVSLAIICFDQASVFTINSFCQKILDDFNSECQLPVLAELINTDDEIKNYVYDFWRFKQKELSVDLLALIPDIEKIINKFKWLLSKSHYKSIGFRDIEINSKSLGETLSDLKILWESDKELLMDFIYCGKFSGNKYPKKSREKYKNDIEEFLNGQLTDVSKFTAESLKSNLNKDQTVYTFPDFFHQLEPIISEREIFVSQFLQECWNYILERLDKNLQENGIYSYSDQIRLVYQAVKTNSNLAHSISNQWQCVMIDEFQDTDALQFEIFNSCFNQGRNSLIYVGDPKQAIYDFRGADVFVYEKAKLSVDEIYNLETNWRSSEEMLNVSNSMFDSNNSFLLNAIAFHPSKSKDDQSSQLIDKEYSNALAVINSPAMNRHEKLKNELLRLLNFAEIQTASETRKLQEKDIAILVKTNSEAIELYEFLISENFSVTLSSEASIFTTEIAKQLHYLIRAILFPSKENVFTTYQGIFFQMNIAEIHSLNIEELTSEFIALRVQSQQQGLSESLNIFLQEKNVYENLLSRNDGERHYTDLIHLLELFQQQQDNGLSLEQLYEWLIKQISKPENINDNNENQKRRLESDGQKITIMTIHKSKGLEFPIVFIPNIEKIKPIGLNDGKLLNSIVAVHDNDNNGIIDWRGTEEAVAKFQLEQEAELMRVLYVAITRAKFRVYLGADFDKNLDRLAITRLFKNLEVNSANIKDFIIDIDERTNHFNDSNITPALILTPFKGEISQPLSVYSFSSLTKNHQYYAETDEEGKKKENFESFFDFPGGTKSGTMQHHILEELDFNAAKSVIQQVSERQLKENGYDLKWSECLAQQIHTVLNTKLWNDGFELKNVRNKIVEMEFLLPLETVDKVIISRWLSQHRNKSTEFSNDSLKGFLTGFIDLIVEFNKKFYIIDYKSNYLGKSFEDYSFLNLEKSVQHHYYDLQYLLYTVAFTRFLQNKIPDFDYSRDFGGVAYIFIRGMKPDEAGQGVYFNKPDKKLIDEILSEFSHG